MSYIPFGTSSHSFQLFVSVHCVFPSVSPFPYYALLPSARFKFYIPFVSSSLSFQLFPAVCSVLPSNLILRVSSQLFLSVRCVLSFISSLLFHLLLPFFRINSYGVGNCLGIFFFSLGNFFWISGSYHFPCYLQHFGAGNCHFHGMCNGFEFEPLIFHCIFHGICNSMSMFCPFSMLFAAFLSWNLHFHRMCNILQLHSSQYLQDFGAEG